MPLFRKYSFSAAEKKAPPATWCLPFWHNRVMEWERRFGHQRRGPKGNPLAPVMLDSGGCRRSDSCPLKPEAMRLRAEKQLRNLGVWPDDVKLPLDVYSLARNLGSEFGHGTPEEQAAVVFVAMNRAKMQRESITKHLIGSMGNYGRQIGSARPASTAQDPTVANLLTAALIYDGYRAGWIEDITHGAIGYFDRVSQDAQAAKRAAEIAAGSEKKKLPNGVALYARWTYAGGFLTWVGHVPGIRPYRLCLMAIRSEWNKTREGKAELEAARKGGKGAILGSNRAPTPWEACEDQLRTEASVSGVAVAGAAAIIAAGIGLAVPVVVSRR